ncbi:MULTISPECIES: Stk1 family PASTA domain-containing Ser/Thr kinase [Rhodococcus]|uniref:non-specific serine/threonine protein kinase n=1 Tax=Rhodococcus cerastii TaxID=908616 RepID=A0ABU4CZV7_9NOCA|nr:MULTISPECIES: Stk1 family PASTA domain-containing Ser/Thr kinase [Rhodococcus]MDV6303008.1 Stk1 family PASTA domain-containing Ser/Thr kinase [Rhodococcus cerastii]MDV8054862.1 Stk1 family PASTA domain-containing Ser/Thr kinase [Rhodococcus sp. IEGM 1343]MDV8079619.1 Stk1 family PASTA domain-containing Ser/Thr kinase [Rhodococcus sp. IEGM 1370]
MTTPRTLSSRYELGEILGFGGMSEVHLARDTRLDRDVAIKVLRADLARDPTFYLRFRREAQNAAALNHPAIVAVYDTGEAETEAGPLPFIVMEYVDGDTLRDIVRAEGPMAPRRAMEVIADVCAALDFSHRNGIVHRDVKPANIMINNAGAVKVMDFGIARAIADSSSPMTQTAAVIGTAQYLSPEQARGEQVDARSDVYSLGCVLFEILTGEPPFKGDSPVAVAYQHVREDPQLPSLVNDTVPRELDSIILKAMAKNPANRYQSAAEMRTDLVRVLGGQRPSAPMVMNDEDRTTILGSVDSRQADFSGKDKPAAAAAGTPRPSKHTEPDNEPRSRRGLKIALISAASIIVVAIVGAFLWSLGPGAEPTSVTVPSVAGLVADEAQRELENVGLRVTVQERPDASVPEGSAIGTNPAAGSQTESPGDIQLDVSSGPQQVQVPRLTGRTQQEASDALNEVGLQLDPTVARAPSTPENLDRVVEQNPSSGVSMNADSQVRITLGSGPAQVRMPNVVGQLVDVAQPNVAGAGLRVQIENIDSSQPVGQVVSTDPAGGANVAENTVVTLRVSNGDKIPMPDLAGLTEAQALTALESAGWTGTASDLSTSRQSTLDPLMVGRIVNQTQPAGSEISKSDTITVSIGALGIPTG